MASPAAAAPSTQGPLSDVSISVNGHTVVQRGNSTAVTTPGRNVAIAINSSYAEASNGRGNVSLAINQASASTGGDGGRRNFAFAFDEGSASAGSGNGNMAVGVKNGSAWAGDGNRNRAFAAVASSATAMGNDNTAIGISDGHTFVSGTLNTAIARCGAVTTVTAGFGKVKVDNGSC